MRIGDRRAFAASGPLRYPHLPQGERSGSWGAPTLTEAEWLKRALAAATVEEVEAAAAAWTPELLIAGRGARAFGEELAASPPLVRDPVERAFRSTVERDFHGWMPEEVASFLAGLTPEQGGDFHTGLARLDRLRFETGHPDHDYDSDSGISWLSSMLHDFVGRDPPVPVFRPEAFVTSLALVRYGLEHWDETDRDGHYTRINWPGAGGPLFVKWAPASREAVGDARWRMWMRTLIEPFEKAISIIQTTRFAEYTTPAYAGALVSLLSEIGETRTSAVMDFAGPLGTRWLADRAADAKRAADSQNAPNEDDGDEDAPSERNVARCRKELQRKARPAVLVTIWARPLRRDEDYPTSYFGGSPLLPDNEAWPHLTFGNGKRLPLSFICQIDLSELPPIRKSPLPETGKLLFFWSSNANLSPVPVHIIHVPAGVATSPRDAPDDLPGLGDDDEYARPWVVDPEHRRLFFRYPCSFAPLETYCDSADGSGTLGWTNGSAYEVAYRELAEAADARVARVLAEALARRPGARRRAKAPSERKDRLHYFRSGPYVQEDARILGAEMKRSLALARAKISPPDGKDSAIDAAGREMSAFLDEVWQVADGLEAGAARAGRWAPFSSDDHRRLGMTVNQLRRRVHLLNERIRPACDAAFKRFAETQPDPSKAWQHWKRPLVDLGEDDIFGRRQGLLEYNLDRLAHEGVDIDAIWPQWLVDQLLPAPNVGPFPQDLDEYEASIDGRSIPGWDDTASHQMLGWGRSVQTAPTMYAKKVMLLQVMGGVFPWLPGPSCVLQVWIDEKDARRHRWDRAFATVECN